jgi:hypothetical protein
MWCACHGVPPLRRSAIHGPPNSTSVSSAAHANVAPTDVSASSSPAQPTCAIEIAVA